MYEAESLIASDLNRPSKCGILQKYQDKLVNKHQAIIVELEARIQSIVSETNDYLSQSIADYQNMRDMIIEEREKLIESLSTTDDDYSEIRDNVERNSKALVEAATQLRESCIKKYDESFLAIQPFITEAYEKCSDFRMQLPESLIERLPFIVKRLNKQYLLNKKQLTEKLFMNEFEATEGYDDAVQRADSFKDAWRTHKVETLTSNAKVQLDYHYPINFGTIYDDFVTDENKFIRCFRKNLENVQILAPPDKFTKQHLDDWNKEVVEILELHQNFITQFRTKIEKKVQERESENELIIEEIKKRLLEYNTEEETTEQISFLMPIVNLTKKVNAEFLKRLNKYWENRVEALAKCFTEIYNFYLHLMESYNGFSDSANEDNEKCKETINQYDKEMKEKVDELEGQISSQIETIKNAVNEKEIEDLIVKCKENLTHIEDQYRDFYTKSIAYLDERPESINQFYESRENELLESLKIQKNLIEQPQAGKGGKGGKKKPAAKDKKRPPKKKNEKKNDSSSFSFTIESYATYDEDEHLEMIPEIPEFEDVAEPQIEEVESTVTTATKGKKGKTSKMSPKKGATSKAGKKSAMKKKAPSKMGKKTGKKGAEPVEPEKVEPQELEMPEIKLFEMVPKIDDHLSIEIFIPKNSDVADYINPLRQAILTELHNRYKAVSKKVEYTDLRKKLVEDLNERVRVHAPRAGDLELNVGTARMTQLEKTKRDIELHFKQQITNFNSEYNQIVKKAADRNQKLSADCEKLRRFIDLLIQQKTSRGFNQLQSQFKLEEKKFNGELDKFNDIQNKDVEALMQNYKFVNEKFADKISTFSNDERDYCNSITERMDAQVNTTFEQLKEQLNEYQKQITEQRDSIITEFGNLFPIHQSDVIFIEHLQTSINQARQKYESLKFKNRQSETEVNKSIDSLKQLIDSNIVDTDSTKLDENQQNSENMIVKQFELLDLVRLLIVKRAKYLGILKSQMSAEPMLINIDFSLTPDNSEDPNLQFAQDPNKKKKVTKPKSKPRKNSSKKADQGESFSGFGIDTTLKDQIDEIGKNLQEDFKTNFGNDYYSELKKRNHEITRPDQIQEDQEKCQNYLKENWEEIISDSADIIQKSSEQVTYQMNDSVKIARLTVTKIYQNVLSYFLNAAVLNNKELLLTFKNELKKFTEKREELKKRLVPKLSDVNHEQEFVDLMKEEIEREIEEKKLIDTFSESLTETENNNMKHFLMHLPNVTQYLLQLFDNFVMKEDLENVQVEHVQRISMKQMLLNMKRKEGGEESFDENRPAFRRRKWPQLSAVMEPIEFITAVPNPRSNLNAQSVSNLSEKRDPDDGSKKVKRNGVTGISKKLIDSSDVEKLDQLESLDTGLSRGAIVEQEKCYQEYEKDLADRIESCSAVIDDSRNDSQQLNQNWRVCSLKLKPNYIFEPI